MMAMPDAELFVARDAEGKLLGAGGLSWRGWRNPAGFPMMVHVLPDSRRLGVGRALVRALVDRARGEADRLWVAQALEEGSEAAAFARACGFGAGARQLHFEADTPSFDAHVGGLIARMRARGRISPDVQTVTLAEVPLEEVARLVSIEFRAAPPHIRRLLEQARHEDPDSAPISFTMSRALMIDGALAGALLLNWNHGQVTIVANVVAPRWRRGWANLLLLADTTRAAVEWGCKTFRFDCADDNRDTIGLAIRGEAAHRMTSVHYCYALTSPAD